MNVGDAVEAFLSEIVEENLVRGIYRLEIIVYT